jgi:O-antigen ligase
MLASLVAVAIQSVFALIYYGGLPDAERAELESLTEHSATVHMNAVIVFAICAWLFHARGWVRWLALVLAVPTAWAYILSQRRAAMVALFAGVIMILVALYIRRRRAFWILAPSLAVVLAGLVLATWNATGPIGLPAQAVKSVLFPNELGAAEQGSDQYRVSENYDLWYTIRAKPLTGFGFGQQFLRPVPLPDISFFEFWEYMSHNSVLWIWVKMGFFGFVSMLFMIGRSIQLGGRSIVGVRTPEQAAVVVTGASYVIMFLVFAYVDIAWLGGRTTIFLAFSFAICADYLGAIDDPDRRAGGIHTHQLASLSR